MTPRRRYTFWINDAEENGLKAVKTAEGISESEQIRQAIRDWLKRKGVQSDRKRASTRKRP
jgi:Arc/MetJ-type ribon-helix-helix transcriptional regulator